MLKKEEKNAILNNWTLISGYIKIGSSQSCVPEFII